MEITSMDILNYIDSIPFVIVFTIGSSGVIIGYFVSAFITLAEISFDRYKEKKKFRSKKTDEET